MVTAYCVDLASLLPSIVTFLTLPTTLVGGRLGSIVAPHTNSCFDIALVVPTYVRFLALHVPPVAFFATSGAAIRPVSEASDAVAVLPCRRSQHRLGILPPLPIGQRDSPAI